MADIFSKWEGKGTQAGVEGGGLGILSGLLTDDFEFLG